MLRNPELLRHAWQMSNDLVRAASSVLRQPGVSAVGVFGVQDQTLAAGLLGQQRAAAATAGLTTEDQASAVMRPWLAVAVLVAVSPHAIHVLDLDPDGAPRVEVARFERSNTAVAIEAHGSGRRLTLTETRTGYRLPLTTTVSRFNGFAAGARSVLSALGPPAKPADPHPAVGLRAGGDAP